MGNKRGPSAVLSEGLNPFSLGFAHCTHLKGINPRKPLTKRAVGQVFSLKSVPKDVSPCRGEGQAHPLPEDVW